MTEANLAAADELRRLAGWNQTLDDWRLLLSFEPQGCFVAVEDDTVIGTVTTTTYGHDLAWIGMMLVHPDHRRRGIGTSLMQRALEFLRGRGIKCIRLDATPAGQPVYERLGFVPEWTLTRYHAASVSGRKTPGVRELAESDWLAVEVLDRRAFGVDRARILHKLANNSRAAWIWPADSTPLWYGMLRQGSQCDYLGPLVCTCPDPCLSLISALLAKATGRPVFWDVPDDNEFATALAKRFGFQAVRPLTRMRLGPDTIKSNPHAQLAIADPSLG